MARKDKQLRKAERRELKKQERAVDDKLPPQDPELPSESEDSEFGEAEQPALSWRPASKGHSNP